MNIEVRISEQSDAQQWDNYVRRCPEANLYHLYDWKNVIEETYGHNTYYLLAINTTNPTNSIRPRSQAIAGVLPLVRLKHFLFDNALISNPFFDMAGILSDNQAVERALLTEAISLGQKLKVNSVELRQTRELFPCNAANSENSEPPSFPSARNAQPEITTQSHKVRMLLELPDSSETLMKSFKSKLRSQIKKPLKEGLKAEIGGTALLDDFYKVFACNMRDLGSPVHSKQLMKIVLEKFYDSARLVIVYKNREPIACSMMVGFRDTLENPWASALRQYSRLSPNMLLYWTMLEYACNRDYRYFDFGRSTPGEGTFKFKAQWGAKPEPLHWHYVYPNGKPPDAGTADKSKFDKAIRYWQKLPVPVTRYVGPLIRKHIGL